MAKLTKYAFWGLIECIQDSHDSLMAAGYPDLAKKRLLLVDDLRASLGLEPVGDDYDFGGVRGKVRYHKNPLDQ